MNNDKLFCLYVHENKVNGKCYVGITSKCPPQKRWGVNGVGYKGQYFYNAINKYGWDNFEHHVLFDNLTIDEASQKERDIIKELKANDREFGYNVADGGYCNIGEIAYQKLLECSEARKIKVIRVNDMKVYPSIVEAELSTGVANSNITKVCRGLRHSAGTMPNGEPMVWRYYLPETDYSNELNIAMYQRNHNRHYTSGNKKVVCVNTQEVFLSLKDAEKKYGVFLENIIKACKGIYRSAGKDVNGNKLRWMYYFDWIKLSDEEKYHTIHQPIINHNQTRIKCIEDDIIFDSLHNAALYYGLNNAVGISAQLRGVHNHVYVDNRTRQIHFIYLDTI